MRISLTHARLDLTDEGLATAAGACRAMEYQEGTRAWARREGRLLD